MWRVTRSELRRGRRGSLRIYGDLLPVAGHGASLGLISLEKYEEAIRWAVTDLGARNVTSR